MRRAKRKLAVLLVMSLVLSTCTGCLSAKEQVFTESNFSITLTNRFEKVDVGTDAYAYEYRDIGVAVTSQSKEEIKNMGIQITSVNRFAILALKSYEGADTAFVRDGLNHCYCEFDTVIDGEAMSAYAAFYESDTHYWLVLFGCPPEKYSDYQANFANWASTVTVQ